MLLVVTVQNAFGFLIAWEIMSLSSFFLVAFENEKKEVFDAGINYLIAMHIGVVFLIIGFVILSIKSGSFDFASFKEIFASSKILTNALFVIFFIGFGMKAGFFPLHTWLPKAHPTAPSHISGFMSGVMIKTGIYGILRILTLTNNFSAGIAYFILFISMVSACIGVMYAISQSDLKKILAYSSIENIGIIGIGIGIGMIGSVYKNDVMFTLGFSGCFLHILNHSIFKGLLFYGAGSVYQKTHTRDIEKLGGIVKYMPYTSVLFLSGSIAISAIPPFNGFISEFLIYMGMFGGIKSADPLIFIISIISAVVLAFVGVMALLCFIRAFSVVFLGNSRSKYETLPKEADKTMLVPMGILAFLAILIGVFPQYIVRIVLMPVKNIMSGFESLYSFSEFVFTLGSVSRMCFLFIGMSVLIYFIRYLFLRKRFVESFKTWDCGYQAGTSRMQYTGSSFADPFLNLTESVLKNETHIKKPAGLFPTYGEFKSHTSDIIDKYIIVPCGKGIKSFLGFFSWIQSGSTQQYILYGLLFLVIVLVWIIGAGK
jgi:formate hydrogenlyase subunit 3/multisubunit Na+/H+ antiporter MnhD subunit